MIRFRVAFRLQSETQSATRLACSDLATGLVTMCSNKQYPDYRVESRNQK
jgi:hypothetical protein